MKPQWEKHLPLLIKYICNDGIKNEAQFNAAVDFLLGNAVKDQIPEEEFKAAAGVGVEVTEDQVEDAVKAVILKNKEALLAQRYAFNVGKLLGEWFSLEREV